KKNGKRRPLGIPVQADRAEQALELLALDPVSETLADACSYGFRKERGAQDAIAGCFLALCRRHSAEWILEGDIRACFDELSHPWLLEQIPADQGKLRGWLNAGFMERGVFHPTTAGTPQGGILSPTAANMALDGLEARLKARFRGHHKVNLIRYADDCVPRRRIAGRKPCVQPCCTRDGGRPPEAAVQAEASNRPLRLPLREVVVS
ncbi:reverse transcriptase domain-containing protein, partial [Thiorhodococcus minor]|uniref:reverse transcriptase domain-containing protein n=1 Tax=Thiorhodococcus minor TaxID=57489 RepID=UPI001FD833FC